MKHPVVWHTAQPLWPLSLQDAGPAPERFRAPALLRFKGDDFMQQLQGVLEKTPEKLADLVAQRESWREEKAGWLTEGQLAGAMPLKLFQPAHYRFYLVAAALVCQLPGLPERRISAAQNETAGFVMRRLVPKPNKTFDPADETTYDEYGWFGTQQSGDWLPVPVPTQLAEGEERLALFPTAFQFEKQQRRLLTGLIPVARRDVYEAGVARTSAPASAAQLRADPFSSPAAAQAFERATAGFAFLADPDGLKPPHEALEANEQPLRSQAKAALAQALLELVEFLEQELEPVWNAIGQASSSGLSGPRLDLYSHLNAFASHTARRWREILVAVSAPSARGRIDDGDIDEAFVDGLLGASLSRTALRSMALSLLGGTTLRERLIAALPDPRPDAFEESVGGKLAALAQPGLSDEEAQDGLLMALLALAEFLQAELPQVWNAVGNAGPGSLSTADRAAYDRLAQAHIGSTDWRALAADAEAHRLEILAGRITPQILVVGQRLSAAQIAQSAAALAASLAAAVNAALATHALPSPAAAHTALATSAPPLPPAAAYYRIRCVYERPQCKGFHEAVVGDPSAPFQLASYFDPDAPVRPIRIQMPDVSLKALRRGPRGVAIAVSKELREQIARVRGVGLKDLADGKLASAPSFDFGLICTLSIPIITICALILLMIIVQLLNIVFWWLPYFILCLPRLGKGS
jgi:hypothetical protein